MTIVMACIVNCEAGPGGRNEGKKNSPDRAARPSRGSHTERTERRAERKEDGEDDSEEDEPVEIQLSDVTMHPKGTPAPASSVEARVFEERVDLSNDMTWRQMIGVGVRNVVLARGELDRLEGPRYAARRRSCAERRKKPREQGTGRRRRRRRTRQRRATRQRKKRQGRERREWDDREVA